MRADVNICTLRYVYNTPIALNKHPDIYFPEIDITFLRRYETWLHKRGVAENILRNYKTYAEKHYPT